MGWISRYGQWQNDLAPPKPDPIRLRHILGAFVFLVIFGSCLACFPLAIFFVPKAQLTEYMPKGIHCATCEEIWQHNRDLFNRDDMFCYGPPVYDRPTLKEEEVMFTKEVRCWTIKKGHDEWMRPLLITDEETRKWEREVQTRTFRGGSWAS